VTFTAAVYHAVPWQYIYRASLVQDVSAPALMAPLMPPWLVIIVLLAVLMAILNSIPSVMLANSRMLYAFSADRVFPAVLARVHPRYRTPHHAITVTAICGSVSVLGCQLARDFFLGVDLLIVSMLVNFVLMAATVVAFPRVNPGLYEQTTFLASRRVQVAVAVGALVTLGALLVVQVIGDVTSAAPWYFKSTTSWSIAMVAAGAIFARRWRRLIAEGVNPRTTIFGELPAE
jgi:amino acid transporter